MSDPNFRLLLRSSNIVNRVPSNSSLIREGQEASLGLAGTELGAVHLVNAKVGDGDPNIVDSSVGLYFKVGTSLDVTSRNKIVRVGAACVTSDGTRPDVLDLNNEDVDYTGNLWYRLDTKDLSINETGARSEEAWYSLTPRYDRETPTPFTVGGVEASETFDNLTLQQVFDKIFYPTTLTSVSSFNISPDPIGVGLQSKKLEIGAQLAVPGGLNLRTLSITTAGFTSITDVHYVAGTDLDNLQPAEDGFLNASYSGTGKNKTLTYTQSTPVSYTVPTKFYWKALLTDAEGNVQDGPYRYVEWAYRSYTFSDTNIIDFTAFDIDARYNTKVIGMGGTYGEDLGVNAPQTGLTRLTTVGKPATDEAEYVYVLLPVGGMITESESRLDGYAPYTRVDSQDSVAVAFQPYTTIVYSRNNIDVLYYIYRSTVATKAAYTVTLF